MYLSGSSILERGQKDWRCSGRAAGGVCGGAPGSVLSLDHRPLDIGDPVATGTAALVAGERLELPIAALCVSEPLPELSGIRHLGIPPLAVIEGLVPPASTGKWRAMREGGTLQQAEGAGVPTCPG